MERIGATAREYFLNPVVVREHLQLQLPGGCHPRLPRLGVEPGEVLDHVGDEVDLALLAVGHHVQPRVGLPANHVRNRRPHLPLERVPVVGAAVLLLDHRLQQVLRPGQASHVGGEDPIGASLHLKFPLC